MAQIRGEIPPYGAGAIKRGGSSAANVEQPRLPSKGTDNKEPDVSGRDSFGLDQALRACNVEVRWNTRGARTEVLIHTVDPSADMTGPKWERVTDRSEAWLRERIAEKTCPGKDGPVPMHFSDAGWKRTLLALLSRIEVDPFLEWLEELPAWDSQERVDSTFHRMFGAEDTPLAGWAARYILCGAIHRAYNPGAKLDQMVVLVGDQGIGKSTFAKELLPPEHQAEWFSDALHLDANPKEQVEALDGRVIVESSELSGLGASGMDELKSFISRADDGAIRRAYARYTTPSPRRCILIGTSNSTDCLPNDPTGLRRFVPIQLQHACFVEAVMHQFREQLWAEAMEAYHDMDDPFTDIGLPADPTHKLRIEAVKVAELYRREDEVLEHRIRNMWHTADGLSMDEIAKQVELSTEIAKDTRLTKRLGHGAPQCRMDETTHHGGQAVVQGRMTPTWS